MRYLTITQRKRLKAIAHLGGLSRFRIYGNPGTMEGRKLGGLNSLKTHRRNDTGFILAKNFIKPRKSEKLAEFFGIIFGDGHLSSYQLSITTNSGTDMEHAHYSMGLIRKLFELEARLKPRKTTMAVDVVVSSVRFVRWLNRLGMPIGNKLTKHLSVPPWIQKNDNFRKGFIRGLFDTDGCVYLDRHIIGGKKYENLGWTITSYSDKLRGDILKMLVDLGYRPTLKMSQKSVYLRRASDIRKYFVEIGSSNNKNLRRFKKFQGRVPKRS